MGPQSHNGCPSKRKGHTEIDTRADTDRNWRDAPASPGAKDCRQPPEAGRKTGIDRPSEPPGGTEPATPDLRLWPPAP